MSSPDQKEEQESLSLEEVSDTEEEEYLESLPELPTIESKDTASLVKRAPRWDQKLKAVGKAPPRNYKSWRAHKYKIFKCLGASGGNVAFTRRYMLFREGVNLPNNIIHYYNSRYCSAPETEENYKEKSSATCQSCGRRRQPRNPVPAKPHLPHPLRHLPAEPRLSHRF
ncbi:22K [Skunk adenovirus 1]|uniref:22K n=1 Tax=Skunk adenovirus 1 TaxID=2698728 RepID=A0A0K0MGC9_9ADEN|nr:22K [Skunk adenovirus PB1]QDF59498.1 putative 22K [African pygmy hedgehog adenovirus 1]QKF54476.1 22K [Skunk adenovirus HUN/2009]UKT59829.1 22K [Raccoon adenovirus]UKT59859.1 22K [Porcupine adenovirus]UWY10656.1 22K [Skunk adenovirus 1]